MVRKWAQPPAPKHQVVLFTETLDGAIPQNHPIRLLKLTAEDDEENLENGDAETLMKGVEALEEKLEKYRKALTVAHKRDEEKQREDGKNSVAVRVPVTDPDSIIAPNKEGGYAAQLHAGG